MSSVVVSGLDGVSVFNAVQWAPDGYVAVCAVDKLYVFDSAALVVGSAFATPHVEMQPLSRSDVAGSNELPLVREAACRVDVGGLCRCRLGTSRVAVVLWCCGAACRRRRARGPRACRRWERVCWRRATRGQTAGCCSGLLRG